MKRPESPMLRLLRSLGKVQFTTVLLLGGVAIMTAGTILESRESRDTAWSAIYGTAWFDVFLLLIGVNLIVAVVNRIPIQRNQWPFVVTHLAIVILLAGAWISRSYGYEGRMVIFEGEEVNRLLLDSSEIRTRWTGPAHAGSGGAVEAVFPFERNADLENRILQTEGAGRPGIRITDHVANGYATRSLGTGGADDPAGVEFRVSGRGIEVDDWLIVDDPEFHHKDLGPIEIVFHATRTVADGEPEFPGAHRASVQLSVSPIGGEPPVRLPLPASIGSEVPCGPGVVAVVQRFFLRARVVDGRVTEAASGELNPAAVVAFTSADAVETHTVFANYPDFTTVDGRALGRPLVSNVALDVSALSAKPVIAILIARDGRMRAQVSTAMGVGAAVPVAVGRPVDLRTRGLSLEVKRLLPRALAEIAVQPSPPGRGGGRSYLRIAAVFEGEGESVWLPRDSSRAWKLSDGRALEVTFGSQTRALPFGIALDEFELITHPGSSRAAEYRSHVRVASAGAGAAEPAVISMNRPFDIGGFRLFQSSYQLGRDGAPDATIFSVSYDPGVPIVYTAFVLLVLGITWGLRTPRHVAAHPRRPPEPARDRAVAGWPAALVRARRVVSGAGLPLMVVVAVALVVVLSLATIARAQPATAPAELPLEETRGWVILADGRAKPLQTFANETAVALTGRKGIDGLSPLEIFWGYALAAEDFRGRPYIRIDGLELKAKLGLSETPRRFSFDALLQNSTLRPLVERAMARQRDHFELDHLEEGALAAYAKLERAAGLISGEALAFVPNNVDGGEWSSPANLARSEDASRRAIHAGFTKLAKAHREADPVAFRREARALTVALRNLGDAHYPSTSEVDRELFYSDFNAFGKAWKLYLLGSLTILLLGFRERPFFYRVGLLLIGAGLACHSIGIGTRWVIAGRAPVSDMYESLVFMGWGAIALGLPIEIWQRRRLLAAPAGLLGFLCLAFAENLPIDSNINPLVPVLAHTSWLSVHVMTIMLSYSALGLAMLLGHALLFVEVFRNDRTALLGSLSKILYKTIQIGVLFLAAGIVFGAIWANESWGRYWGWDPKETWSLITFFVYLAIIHARFAGWLRSFGLAASAVLGFLAVIMTYYGVNFILASGMHAYGFAEGDQFYVGIYAVFECAIVVAAQILRTTAPRQNHQRPLKELEHGRLST